MTAPLRPHTAIRIDALPPDADPGRRFYRCQHGCDYLTGAQLRHSAIPHQVPDPAQLLSEHYRTGVTGTPARAQAGCGMTGADAGDLCPACGSDEVLPFAIIVGAAETYGYQCLTCAAIWPVLVSGSLPGALAPHGA